MYKWIKEEDLQEVVNQGRDERLDLAESKLDEKIDNGDTTALIFFLKTQGKLRGYTEKQELEIDDKNKPDLSKLSDDELLELARMKKKLSE